MTATSSAQRSPLAASDAERARLNALAIMGGASRTEPINIWPVPDMSVLNSGRRAPVPMPADLFGDAWGLICDIAEGTATAPDYAALGYLTACASLIGGKRRLRPYESASWAEPCILWAGCVGDPSSRKSPALDTVTAPLRSIELDEAEAHKANLRVFVEASELAKVTKAAWQADVRKAVEAGHSKPPMPTEADEPEEPHRRRCLVGDATPEAMGAILAGNPSGTLHFRDELAGWLVGFDRYAPGGREFWLESFGGRPFTIDRKGARAPLHVPFNGVSVVGGVQPSKLAAALFNGPDDGLVARFLWAWPDKLPFKRPRRPADMAILEAVYRRLDGLSWAIGSDGRDAPVTLALDADAADIFEDWQADNSATDLEATGLYASFVGKMDGVVLRLALVAEMSRWAFSGGDEPRSVTARSLIAAAAFVDDYAKPMAQRVYGDAALPKVERDAAVLARYLIRLNQRVVNKRALSRSPHKSEHGLRGDALGDALEHLATADWLRDASARDGESIGRKREDYAVNPRVFEVIK